MVAEGIELGDRATLALPPARSVNEVSYFTASSLITAITTASPRWSCCEWPAHSKGSVNDIGGDDGGDGGGDGGDGGGGGGGGHGGGEKGGDDDGDLGPESTPVGNLSTMLL